MKKPLGIALVTLICCGLLVTGCRARPAALKDLSAVIGRDLLYLGKDGGRRIIVDPGDGKRYAVTGQAGTVFDPVPAFAEISLAEDEAGKPFLRTATALSARVPIIACESAKAAAAAYPAALLAGMRYSDGEYALQDYTIGSTKVLADTDGKIMVEFVADVMPVRSRFAPFAGYGWGKPGSDGFVRGLRLVINLYANGGQYCLYAPSWRTFAEGAPTADYPASETQYRPVTYEDPWLAMEEGKETEHVLYEDGAYSFTCGVRLRRGKSEYFEATIYRIDRATGDRLAMFDLPRGTYWVMPFALNDRRLYLSTTVGRPYSEGRPDQIASIDLDTGEYTVLLTGPATVLGSTSETYYIIGFFTDSRAGGIYALDAGSGSVRKVSALPGSNFDPGYEGAGLHHISGGRLFVLWPESITGVPGPTYAIYAIDPATGMIEKQPR